MMDERELAHRAREALGLEIAFAVACDPVPVDDLSAGERARLESLRNPGRREEWLRGRAALKRLLRRLGDSDDTSLLSFPHARISLTHSAGLAIAAGLSGEGPGAVDSPLTGADPGAAALPGAGVRGLGLDFEARRPMRPGTERFFLADRERERLEEDGACGTWDLLRLWTVKEALFKSDPGNRDTDGGGRHLWSYVLGGSMLAKAGSARCSARVGGSPGLAFHYFTMEPEEGFLSLAMSTYPGAFR